MRGFSFALVRTMETIILSFVLSLYAIPRKSQALRRKFTSASSGPDNDHQAVFPAIDGLMADADTQLGIDRGRHIFIVHPDHRRTAGEPLYLLKGAHPGGVESNKAHEIALLVGFQAVLQEAFQRLTGVYGEVLVQPADDSLWGLQEPVRGERGPNGAGQRGDAVRDFDVLGVSLEDVGDGLRDEPVLSVSAAGTAGEQGQHQHARKGEGKELFQFHGRILRSLWCF